MIVRRDELKDYINQQQPIFLEAAKRKGFVCPVCGNGTGETGDGIIKDPTGDGQHYKCFKCNLYENVIGLYGAKYGISDFKEQLEAAATYYGVQVDSNAPAARPEPRKAEPLPETDYSDFIREAAAHISETDYHRGIKTETLQAYNVGFVKEWRHPKIPNAPATPRLIIPTSNSSYIARDTRPADQIPDRQKPYTKSNVGKAHIFNLQELYKEASGNIYITEGAIDALTIIDNYGRAIALNSTANINLLVKLLESKKPLSPLIICMDNDDAGKEAADKLATEFDRLGIFYLKADTAKMYLGCKDANEAYTKDDQSKEDFFIQLLDIDQTASDAYKAYNAAAIAEVTGGAVSEKINAFIDRITAAASLPAIKTGYPPLDERLDGGLYAGLYIIGAEPSLGKTTFCLQMADQIAATGQDVVIFSLEMERDELIAKSVSREMFRQAMLKGETSKDVLTTRNILAGRRYIQGQFYEYNANERANLQQAIQIYQRKAENLYIYEGSNKTGTKEIGARIDSFITATGSRPVVVVDYLQIMAADDVRATDKQNADRAITALKKISRDFRIPVIVISSLNRGNYNTNDAGFEAFKESGGIEYGADVAIILQYADIDDSTENKKDMKEIRKENLQAERSGKPERIKIDILKNRNGCKGSFDLAFYPRFNYFTTWQQPKQNGTRPKPKSDGVPMQETIQTIRHK